MDNTFKTYDLALAACLHVNQFEIIELDRSNMPRVQFVFSDTEELQLSVRSFWNHKEKVDALDYFNSIKVLKTRIYND